MKSFNEWMNEFKYKKCNGCGSAATHFKSSYYGDVYKCKKCGKEINVKPEKKKDFHFKRRNK